MTKLAATDKCIVITGKDAESGMFLESKATIDEVHDDGSVDVTLDAIEPADGDTELDADELERRAALAERKTRAAKKKRGRRGAVAADEGVEQVVGSLTDVKHISTKAHEKDPDNFEPVWYCRDKREGLVAGSDPGVVTLNQV